MNKETKTLVSANQLVWGDLYRPNADKRYANQWNRVLNAVTSGGVTVITYRVEGTDSTNVTRVPSLSTMEVFSLDHGGQVMTIVDTFTDFVLAVEDYIFTSAPDSWRAGQTAFNLLCRVRPDLAELIRGSDFDPFHSDSNLPEFYGFLARHWDDDRA